jgi:hypothetical protein
MQELGFSIFDILKRRQSGVLSLKSTLMLGIEIVRFSLNKNVIDRKDKRIAQSWFPSRRY